MSSAVAGSSAPHVAEQPSPLDVLPSSHCSVCVSTMPSPHRRGVQSRRQAAWGALELLAPASHCSTPVRTKLSPHVALTQVFRHASALLVLPSSHCSVPFVVPSPQQAPDGVWTQ